MYTQDALKSYTATGPRMAAEHASPHRLIDMLLERALARIATAKGHMQRNQHSGKGEHISGAMAIVNGLRTFLDKDAGGSLAADLDALYEYMSRRLLEANVGDDAAILDEVAGLLREIRSAWVAIADEVDQASSAGVAS